MTQTPYDSNNHFRLVDPEGVLLDEIADSRMTRDDVAVTYAFALRQPDDDVDWAKVNGAILSRWSISALKYIKEQAWKRLEAS